MFWSLDREILLKSFGKKQHIVKCEHGYDERIWTHWWCNRFCLVVTMGVAKRTLAVGENADNDGPDQTAHPRSLIWAFVVRPQDAQFDQGLRCPFTGATEYCRIYWQALKEIRQGLCAGWSGPSLFACARPDDPFFMAWRINNWTVSWINGGFT